MTARITNLTAQQAADATTVAFVADADQQRAKLDRRSAERAAAMDAASVRLWGSRTATAADYEKFGGPAPRRMLVGLRAGSRTVTMTAHWSTGSQVVAVLDDADLD